MLASLEAKLIVLGVLLALLTVAGVWFGAHERAIGKAEVQAQWDTVKAAQAATAIKASEAARKTEADQTNAFADITTDYLQANTHVPSIADTLPAFLAAGTLRLRDTCPAAPASRGVPEAAAAARAADAAATAALAQRTADDITAVRITDAADKRESDFRALIASLRALLKAERQP